MSVRRISGFTMMEMMVSIAILAIITAFAVPSFRALSQNATLSATTSEFVGDLNQARSDAISRKNSVTFAPVSTANWAQGWTTVDSAATQLSIRNREAAGVTATVTPNTVTNIVFNRDGTVQGWSSSIVITICDDRAGETGRSLAISRLGQITNSRLTCP